MTEIYNSGGIGRIVIDKINYLANTPGYEVSISYFGPDKSFYPIDAKVKRFPLREKQGGGHNTLARTANTLKMIPAVRNIIKETNPDIIVNANMVIVSWILPFIYRNIPKIVELHFSYKGLAIMNKELHPGNASIAKAISFIRHAIYPLYSRCVVLTDDDKTEWGFKNCYVIPNFTSLPPSAHKINNTKNAIHVGRLDHVKQQNILIDAWKIVVESYPEWKLNIWGNGPLQKRLDSQINELKLQENVFLRGTSTNIQEEYQKSCINILCSKYEGFPMVILESLHLGVPCVSFDVNGAKEAIIDGENGYLVREKNAEGLAKGIIKMIENMDRIESFSDTAKQSSVKYSKENVMNMWIELFDDLCMRKKK